jgi:hypothetical protein
MVLPLPVDELPDLGCRAFRLVDLGEDRDRLLEVANRRLVLSGGSEQICQVVQYRRFPVPIILGSAVRERGLAQLQRRGKLAAISVGKVETVSIVSAISRLRSRWSASSGWPQVWLMIPRML